MSGDQGLGPWQDLDQGKPLFLGAEVQPHLFRPAYWRRIFVRFVEKWHANQEKVTSDASILVSAGCP